MGFRSPGVPCRKEGIGNMHNIIDITNKKFNLLTPIKIVRLDHRSETVWLCQCDCGNTTEVTSYAIRSNNTKSCGCLRKKKTQERQFKDLTGAQFSKLKVIKVAGQTNRKGYIWECFCECGKVCNVTSSHLIKGMTKSCGCLFIEHYSSKANKLHMSKLGKSFKIDDYNSCLNLLFRRYQANASNSNRIFDLTLNQFKTLINQNCHYCGEQPSTTCKSRTSSILYNGIDRKDNNIGYILSNSISCCKMCNRMKHVFGQDEFLTKIEAIYKKLKGNSGA